MIMVTRRNGTKFALNPDLLERAEATPDTVLTLTDGTKYVVEESVEELIDEVRQFRASVVAAVDHLSDEVPARPTHLRPVTDGER
ncbi:MAG: flagellar protein FlbD [Frankiales bacterium]|jgi:flagellar protein FlbD|nr:flagellar protein FlbD [Frankiales bacterium]